MITRLLPVLTTGNDMSVSSNIRSAKNRRGRLASARRGAHVVEFALTVPILFMLVMAGIEFYRVSMLRQYAENVSYEAA